MHITGMSIGAIPPISERITMKFDEQVNVFAGANASGKSTILRWIRSETSKAVPDTWIKESLEEGIDVDNLGVSEDWSDADMGRTMPGAPPPVIFVGSIRPLLPDLLESDPGVSQSENANEILEEDFSGTRVKLAIETLRAEVWDMKPDRSTPYISLKGDKWRNYYKFPERHNLLKVNDVVDRCVKLICGEVIRGSSSHNYVPGPDVRGYLQGPRGAEPINVHLDMAVDTNDIRNFAHMSPYEAPSASAYSQDADALPIYAGAMSDGVQGTLLWIRWLALKMVSHYEFRTDWEEMPAILLIDEIENHLHPTWQRRVIPALLEHFPGLQIFATTHSPFVVAGLKAGQVHMLSRDGNGVVTATTNKEAIEGWTADEILRVFMGVDDPTDERTASAARELRTLRDEGVRADEKNEEERQAEIQRLRRIVDRVELSGPRVAEDDRFLANLDAILEQHRQSQALNQENG